MPTRPAALLTKKSPAITSDGRPEREYGSALASMIGKREKMARPDPRAPLGVSLDVFNVAYS
jgi:hypothetical protein